MAELRVAIDARLRTGEAGGVESVVIGLASGLSGLDAADERYYFLCDPDSTAWLEPYLGGQCELLPVLSKRRANGALTRARAAMRRRAPLARTIWRKRPLLPGEPIALPSPSDGTIEATGIDVMHFTIQDGFLTRVPSIYHPHDLQHVHLPQFFSPRERALRDRTYRSLCEQAALVVVTSSWGRRDVIAHLGISPRKVRVIPWAPATAAYATPTPSDLAEIRARLHLPDRFILYPAQTWPHKNHAALLRALARVRDARGEHIPVVFSGHRNIHAPQIDRLVSDLRLTDQVTWVGFVTPLELQALYRQCRAVVIPSRFEAASGPLWEAFLAGVPAAAAAVTSVPDQANGAALLFDPDDIEGLASVLTRLWTDDALGAELVARGRDNVARFSWERTARMFRAEYRRLAGRPIGPEDDALLNFPAPI